MEVERDHQGPGAAPSRHSWRVVPVPPGLERARGRSAEEILGERYARGEITAEELSTASRVLRKRTLALPRATRQSLSQRHEPRTLVYLVLRNG